jgi:hypothetical protein
MQAGRGRFSKPAIGLKLGGRAADDAVRSGCRGVACLLAVVPLIAGYLCLPHAACLLTSCLDLSHSLCSTPLVCNLAYLISSSQSQWYI